MKKTYKTRSRRKPLFHASIYIHNQDIITMRDARKKQSKSQILPIIRVHRHSSTKVIEPSLNDVHGDELFISADGRRHLTGRCRERRGVIKEVGAHFCRELSESVCRGRRGGGRRSLLRQFRDRRHHDANLSTADGRLLHHPR